jgi:hypothetical protein
MRDCTSRNTLVVPCLDAQTRTYRWAIAVSM